LSTVLVASSLGLDGHIKSQSKGTNLFATRRYVRFRKFGRKRIPDLCRLYKCGFVVV